MATWSEIFQRAQTALVSGHQFGHLITYTEAAQKELGLSSREIPSLARLILLSKQILDKQQGGEVDDTHDTPKTPELVFEQKVEETPLPSLTLPEPIPELESVPEAMHTGKIEETLEPKTDPPPEGNEPTEEILPPALESLSAEEAAIEPEEVAPAAAPAKEKSSGKGSKKGK